LIKRRLWVALLDETKYRAKVVFSGGSLRVGVETHIAGENVRSSALHVKFGLFDIFNQFLLIHFLLIIFTTPVQKPFYILIPNTPPAGRYQSI